MMNNIILIGMMGSGKSTISKSLSRIFSYDLYDTDTIIEDNEKKSINEIFSAEGEKYFRDLEYETAKSLESIKKSVVSTGGGIILNQECTKIFRAIGKVIYLRGTNDTLFDRLVDQTDNRPLLDVTELRNKIDSLLASRKELYESAAHYIVDIDNKDINQISTEIYNLVMAI